MANLPLPGGGPPDLELIRDRLLKYLRVPPTAAQVGVWRKLAEQKREARYAQLEAMGLGAPWEEFGRNMRERTITGSKMVWPFRITWKEYQTGKGIMRVLENEKTIGLASYWDRVERERLVNLFTSIIMSQSQGNQGGQGGQ